MASRPPNKNQSNDDLSKSREKKARQSSASIGNLPLQISTLLSTLLNRPGVHTATYLSAAGFQYTSDGDTAKCIHCGLEVSQWTLDMNPFTVHYERNPNCSFILSLQPSSLPQDNSSTTNIPTTSIPSEQENPSKRQKTVAVNVESISNTLAEIDRLKQVRRRTFSHWPHRTIPSSEQMIEAGFFYCNVGDRVICTYCNLICQQWTPHTDDPCEVHKTLAPNCIYVKAKLTRPAASSIVILNESSTGATANSHSPTPRNLGPLRSNEILYTAACNPAYIEIPKRQASFAAWPNENSPSVDGLVRAGFFYTGTKTIVTCFYCNGSLQNWGPNDNPTIEHARWFPNCAYAKQLCGDELYRKIQEHKRAQQERAKANELKGKTGSITTSNTKTTTNTRQLLIPDESTLSRLVAARLDLPITQNLIDRNFKLSIIRRCWEDQLRLKQEDFVSDDDLTIACIILQKQIEHIDGKKENIVIPQIIMHRIREQVEKERNESNFTEERESTVKREQSFTHWPHSSPSPIEMLTAGWLLDRARGADYTICPYCDVKHHHWQPNDNSWLVHRQLSPFCPFILSSHPIHPPSVSIKLLGEMYKREELTVAGTEPIANVIPISSSLYRLPPKREESFSTFPGGPPQNIEALVKSGFHYTGFGTRLRCYHCGVAVNNFHQHPSNEINFRHLHLFPHCRFAQLLPQQWETRSTAHAGLCKWCLINRKEMTAFDCMHFAVCRPCTQLINTCPICGEKAKAFVKLFT